MNKALRKICTLALLSVFFGACANQTPAPPMVEKTTAATSKASETRVSAAETDSAEPNIAAAPDGGVFVVWTEHGAGKQADVYLQKFDGAGKILSAPARVNPNAGEATAWRGDPPTVKAGKDGKIYVGWTASVERNGAKGTNLMLSVSGDGGETFAAPVKVNDDAAPVSHGMHSLAVGDDNRVFLAWLDERNVKMPEKAAIESSQQNSAAPEFQIVKIFHNSNNHSAPAKTDAAPKAEMAEPNSEVFYAVSADGGATFSPNKKISSEVCPCCKTHAAIAPDGRIFVSWRQVLPGDFRHIAVASSADGGANFGAPVVVSDDRWQINACPVSGASIAFADSQRLEIIWFSGGASGAPGLYVSESADGGKTFAPRRAVYENEMVGASNLISGAAQNSTAIFESNGKLFSQKLASAESGNPKEIGTGETPAAVSSGGKIFTAFVKKEAGKRGVWLNVSDN